MNKNNLPQTLRNLDVNLLSFGHSTADGPDELHYAHVKRDELAQGIAAGHVPLEGGHFTVGGVEVPEDAVARQRSTDIHRQHRPKSGAELHFGEWHNTTQEPPVVTPAEMHVTRSPGGAAGLLAKATMRSAVTISQLHQK